MANIITVPDHIKFDNVPKSIVDPRLLQHYNIIIRRLPKYTDIDQVFSTFDIFEIKKIEIKDNSDVEKIICLRVTNEVGQKMFEMLNKKVIEIEGVWYPIELIFMKDYIKVMRSDEITLEYSKKEQNKINKTWSLVNITKNLFAMVVCYILYCWFSILIGGLDYIVN